MDNAMLIKWTPAALALEEPMERLTLPLHVLTGEAVDVARFVEAYGTTKRDERGNIVQPGLDLVAREGGFSLGLGQEILEIQEATQAAQTQVSLSVAAPSEPPMARAEFILREIVTTAEFAFDDGVLDVEDARLDALATRHESPTSQDALAAALDDYAGFAAMHRGKLDGLGGFDVALIDEASVRARELRERSAQRLVGEPSAQREAIDLRNRLATLLYERMQTVRSAARFVFRNEPDVVRRVTSAYQRRRVALRRQRGEAEATAPVEGA